MAQQLWPDYDPDEITDALTAILNSSIEAAFLLRNQEQIAVGFINLSLRYDAIPGATQKPVAYVEGVYTRPELRRRGGGKLLIEQAEKWAENQGCAELTADVADENLVSLSFHKQVGFEQVNRVVTFIKHL